jgi:glycosyltransferase involved in cell wall biosynthesis
LKLIVQIPCYNEETTLPEVVAGIPKNVPGFKEVEILVVDDGSTDGTVRVARELGVDHIVCHRTNQGLARAFRTGLDVALSLDADVIVNTDGDHQYPGDEIPRLTQPIVEGTADIVVGDRRTETIEHFSPLKKRLQALGSRVVRALSGTTVPDAVSGFRAISREAALHLNILSPFSYTIEMLIQAGSKQLSVVSVPIHTNPSTRRSRLARSTAHFISRSVTTMARIYSMYRPLRTFFWVGVTVGLVGVLPIVRFLYLWSIGEGAGHIQSLVLGGVLVMVGFMTLLIGLVADLIGFNRQLIELTLEKVRRLELREEGRRIRLDRERGRFDAGHVTDSEGGHEPQPDPLDRSLR